MIKTKVNGQITSGKFAPLGEIFISEDITGYYLFIYPNDGSTSENTNKKLYLDLHFKKI